MLNKRIEKITREILQEFGIAKLPVPIEQIAKQRGLKLKSYDLGENISGVLAIDSGKGTIGFNPRESKVRQRFTVAHELGHYELHYKNNELFVDKEFNVLFRDQNSSTGELKKEQEANGFAASILMPESFLIQEIKKNKFDLSEEKCLKELSKLFHVSVTAMTFRIANLNLFSKIN
jgi:Zn-dependent peptidase ImmA (M78 family)